MLPDDWTETVVAIAAIYAAFLSTLNFLMQRRASRPQLKIDLVEETYTERQDAYGQIHRGPSRSRWTLSRTSMQNRVDALKVSARNTGQTDIVLKLWAIQLPDGHRLFSEEIGKAEATLKPRRRIDSELRLQQINDLRLEPPPRRVRYLIGLYEDTLGNVYKSRRMKPSQPLRALLETQNHTEGSSGR